MTNPIADPFVEVPDTDTQSDLVRIDATPEGAVTVIIDRAAKNNAFNAELIAALREAFETLHAADGVRVVFVRGEGGNFSAAPIWNGCAPPATSPRPTTAMTPCSWRSCSNICTTFPA